MANIFDFFPSNYLKADDLGGQPRQVSIAKLSVETLGDGTQKPALHFTRIPKLLLLNKTNATALAQSFGPDFSAWAGQKIILFSAPVTFQGQTTNAIRVSAPKGSAQPPQQSVFDVVKPEPPAQPEPPAAPPAPTPSEQVSASPAATPPVTPPESPTATPTNSTNIPPAESDLNWEV